MWIADAHRGDGKRFVVRADEKLTAFLELELAIRSVAGTVRGTSYMFHRHTERSFIADGQTAFL